MFFIHTLYYIHAVDTNMINTNSINDYMIMFNVCITALACLDGYVRVETLIAVRLRTAFTLITD